MYHFIFVLGYWYRTCSGEILDLFQFSLFVELISCMHNSYTRTLVSMKILTNNGLRESERIYDMYFIYTHPPISLHPFIHHLFPKRCRNEGRTILVTIFFLFVLLKNRISNAKHPIRIAVFH